jgi:predicted CoA-binding protein
MPRYSLNTAEVGDKHQLICIVSLTKETQYRLIDVYPQLQQYLSYIMACYLLETQYRLIDVYPQLQQYLSYINIV